MIDPNCDFARSPYFRKHYTALLNEQGTAQRQLLAAGKPAGSSQLVHPAHIATSVPSIELAVLKAIDEREMCLSRLHALLSMEVPDADDEPRVRGRRLDLADALASLRLAGVSVCETVSRWRKRRGRNREPFIWRSHNYLLKMLVDSLFIGLADTIAAAISDPFHLRCFP